MEGTTINSGMLNYKTLLAITSALLLLYGCQAPNYIFRRDDIITKNFIDSISIFLGGIIKDPITRVSIFESVIQEKLVASDAVAEYKLMDSLSGRPSVDLAINRYSNRLYFYQLESLNAPGYGVFLAATFEANGNCIGIGPCYIGFIGKGDNGTRKFTTGVEYSLAKESSAKSPVLRKKLNSQKLIFIYTPVLNEANEIVQMRIVQVIQRTKNKVSGINKPLVYDIKTIFNDSMALTFSRIPH